MTGYGRLTVSAHEDPTHPAEYRLRVDDADERVQIAHEVLEEVERNGHPDATFVDGVLRIVGTNRTVAYRIGELAADGSGAPWHIAERLNEE